jgi:hypothetical protein
VGLEEDWLSRRNLKFVCDHLDDERSRVLSCVRIFEGDFGRAGVASDRN